MPSEHITTLLTILGGIVTLGILFFSLRPDWVDSKNWLLKCLLYLFLIATVCLFGLYLVAGLADLGKIASSSDPALAAFTFFRTHFYLTILICIMALWVPFLVWDAITKLKDRLNGLLFKHAMENMSRRSRPSSKPNKKRSPG